MHFHILMAVEDTCFLLVHITRVTYHSVWVSSDIQGRFTMCVRAALVSAKLWSVCTPLSGQLDAVQTFPAAGDKPDKALMESHKGKH